MTQTRGNEHAHRSESGAKPGHERFEGQTTGEPITIGNEFAEISVSRVETRNGSRLLIRSPRSGQWVALCPLELEALTWQSPATFSAMIGKPFNSLFDEDQG